MIRIAKEKENDAPAKLFGDPKRILMADAWMALS